MLAIALFSLGSACAASRGLGELVAAYPRVLQGLGGALLLPVGRLSVLRTFPRGEFLQAMSFVAIPGHRDCWARRWAAGWCSTRRGTGSSSSTCRSASPALSPRSVSCPDARASSQGASTSGLRCWPSAWCGCCASGRLPTLGLRQAGALVLGVFGFAALVVYWHAVRHPQPLFSTQLFRVRTRCPVGLLLGNLFCRLGSGAMPFLIPISLQISLGYSPLHAGLMMRCPRRWPAWR